MQIYWSDDLENIIIDEESGEQESYSFDEFIELYGEDKIPELIPREAQNEVPEEASEELEEPALTETEIYYGVLGYFLNAIGSYLHLKKLGDNADDGVYIAQKVRRDYGLEDVNYDLELEGRKNKYLKYLDRLSEAGTKLGFLPLSMEDRKNILRFLPDVDRRRYVRDTSKRCLKRGEKISILGLIEKRRVLEYEKNHN